MSDKLRYDLTSLLDLFRDPRKWIKKSDAKDEDHHNIDPTSEDAVCWCMIGGCQKIASGKRYEDMIMALSADLPPNHLPSTELVNLELKIVHWNDHPYRTHADVLAHIRKVISREAEPRDP